MNPLARLARWLNPPAQQRQQRQTRHGSTRIERGKEYRKLRPGLDRYGTGADFHFTQEDYYQLIELARDWERNDVTGKCIVDRCVHNVVQGGITVEPQTGDAEFDAAILERWGDGPRDITGSIDFRTAQEIVLRSCIRDGDAFAALHPGGVYELIEAHEVHGRKTKEDTILGVQATPYGRPVAYWVGEKSIPASECLHILDRTRATQTRGVSAFQPLIDHCGMYDDMQWAMLIKHRIAASFALIRNRPLGAPTGDAPSYGDATIDQSTGRVSTTFSPGMEFSGAPGETLSVATTSVGSDEFRAHSQDTLRIIAAALGVPLIAVLFDASDTNFSGWRGAMDQARIGWSRLQDLVSDSFVRPVYRHWLAQQCALDPDWAATARRLALTAFSHRASYPRWPYIQPVQDVQAQSQRIQTMLAPPSEVLAEGGAVWASSIAQTVADNALAWRTAIAESQKIKAETGVTVPANLLLVIDPKVAPIGGDPPRADAPRQNGGAA